MGNPIKTKVKKPQCSRELLAKKMGYDFAFEKKVGFPVDIKKIYDDDSVSSSYDIWFKKNLEIL